MRFHRIPRARPERMQQPSFAERVATDPRVQKILALQDAGDPRVRCDLDDDAYEAAVRRFEAKRKRKRKPCQLRLGGVA